MVKWLLLLVVILPCRLWAQSADMATATTVAEFVYNHQSFFNRRPSGEYEVSRRHFVEPYIYLTENFGLIMYGYYERDNLALTVGPYYDLINFGEASVLELGVSIGGERFKNDSGKWESHLRYAGLVYIGNPKIAFASFYYETGSSGEPWYQFESWISLNPFWMGAIGQSNDGLGPRVGLRLPKLPVRVWGAVLALNKKEGETAKYMFGIDLNLEKKK